MTTTERIAKDKLIVALDVDSALKARDLLDPLRGLVGMFKIGSQLFTAAGPDIVRQIVSSGERVFLDLKFHDIPNTVAGASRAATRLGVSIFNVHAAGGGEMMRRAAEAVSEAAETDGLIRPAVIAVTLLTSANAATLAETGVNLTPEEQVRLLSGLAEISGMDGVVASPLEVALVRSAVKTSGFLVVTPGVRPPGADRDDQKRVMTPAQAITAGSDYIVVGRPIVSAKDPARAAQSIVEEIENVPV